MKTSFILGIDGGATKTDMVLTDQQETILARVHAGPSNIHTIEEKTIVKNLREGLHELFKQAGLPRTTKLTALGAGFAGIDNEQLHRLAVSIIKQAMGKSLPSSTKKIQVVNDTIIGFWSGTSNNEGICIIGGTGSNCYGRTKRGKEAWASGLDWILSDEGSGWEQGWKALRATVKSYDGRGPKTAIEKMVYKHYKIKQARELLKIVYEPDYGKHDIGKLAIFVEEAALAGDKVAKQICKESAQELFSAIQAVGKKLSLKKNTPVEIVLIGGVIQNNPVVKRAFKQLVKKIYPKAVFIIPKVKPAMGSVRLAISTIGKKG